MEKLSTVPLRTGKKAETKKSVSPYNPLREKAKGKETRPGSCTNPPRPRGRTCARYAVAGAAADELIAILGGRPSRDRRVWAFYCYHHDAELLIDKAHEYASKHRQDEIRNPVTAFQRWLIRNFGREAR